MLLGHPSDREKSRRATAGTQRSDFALRQVIGGGLCILRSGVTRHDDCSGSSLLDSPWSLSLRARTREATPGHQPALARTGRLLMRRRTPLAAPRSSAPRTVCFRLPETSCTGPTSTATASGSAVSARTRRTGASPRPGWPCTSATSSSITRVLDAQHRELQCHSHPRWDVVRRGEHRGRRTGALISRPPSERRTRRSPRRDVASAMGIARRWFGVVRPIDGHTLVVWCIRRFPAPEHHRHDRGGASGWRSRNWSGRHAPAWPRSRPKGCRAQRHASSSRPSRSSNVSPRPGSSWPPDASSHRAPVPVTTPSVTSTPGSPR